MEDNFTKFSTKRIRTRLVDFRERKVSRHAQMTAWKRRWSRDQTGHSRERYARHGNMGGEGVISLDFIWLQWCITCNLLPAAHVTALFTTFSSHPYSVNNTSSSTNYLLSFLLCNSHDKSAAAHATQSEDRLRRHSLIADCHNRVNNIFSQSYSRDVSPTQFASLGPIIEAAAVHPRM